MTSTAEMQEEKQIPMYVTQTNQTDDLPVFSPFTIGSEISDKVDLSDLIQEEGGPFSNGPIATHDDLPEQGGYDKKDGRLDSEEPSDSSTTSMETSNGPVIPLVPSGGSMQSVDRDEAGSSAMNGPISSKERCRIWREKRKTDPEFREKECKRSRDRRQKQKQHKTRSMETQTDISVSGLEVLRKMVPLPEHPGKYTFADQMEGNAKLSYTENISEKDFDLSTTNPMHGTEIQLQERDRPRTLTAEIHEISNDVDTGETTAFSREGVVQERIVKFEDAILEELYTPSMECCFPFLKVDDEGLGSTDIQTFKEKIYIWSESTKYVLEAQNIRSDPIYITTDCTKVNPQTGFAISPGTGAIWYTRNDNYVLRHFNGKCEKMFWTNFPPKLLLVESSNDKDTLYLSQRNELEMRGENGQTSGQGIRFVSRGEYSFEPATMKRDSKSKRLLVTDDTLRCPYAVLIDKSLQQTIVNFEYEGQIRNIQCGCFGHNGDIIVGSPVGICVLSGSCLTVKQHFEYPTFASRLLCLQNNSIMALRDGNVFYSFEAKNNQHFPTPVSQSH